MSNPVMTTRINDSLSAVWNTDDPIYKSFVSNKNGTIAGTINIPTDISIGAIAGELEYLRLLSLSLSKQIYLDQSDNEFLTFILDKFFNIPRNTGETNTEWLTRATSLIFQPRVSEASLIYVLRPYSTTEPLITSGVNSSMFADYSFADRYGHGVQNINGEMAVIFPAIANNINDVGFTIIITLTGTPSSQYLTVVNLINSTIASGISYSLVIN